MPKFFCKFFCQNTVKTGVEITKGIADSQFFFRSSQDIFSYRGMTHTAVI